MTNCIFCNIIEKKAEATIIHETETLIVFKDIRSVQNTDFLCMKKPTSKNFKNSSPISDFHYLAVPKNHIRDCNSLTIADKGLVEAMQESLKIVLEEGGCNMNDSLLGFHWPPFNSVKHLHMHGVAPASNIEGFKAFMFKPNSAWFKTVLFPIIKSLIQA